MEPHKLEQRPSNRAGPCDPLIFSKSKEGPKTIRNWPEWHESRLTKFDLYDMEQNVTLSRSLSDGTYTLFIDGITHDKDRNLILGTPDGKLTQGTEWLYDHDKNVFEILSSKIIDSNQDGTFDKSDDLWYRALIQVNGEIHTPREMSVVGFAWKGYHTIPDDSYGQGSYCDWVREGCEHFRIKACHDSGVLLKDGTTFPSFSGVMGRLT